MNILRLSTISLTLAIAVFALGYANPSFAAPKKCAGNPDPIPPGCGGGEDPSGLTYTVAVTGGSFPFGPVPATLNGQENTLSPTMNVPPFTRPGDYDDCLLNSVTETQNACLAWDFVFNQCVTPFEPDPVPLIKSFVVAAGNLSVQRPGDRTVLFNGILLPTADAPVVEIWVHLIGPEDGGFGFVPRNPMTGELAVGTISIPMTRFWSGGRTVKGVKPRNSCHPKGTGIPDTLPLLVGGNSTLVITAAE